MTNKTQDELIIQNAPEECTHYRPATDYKYDNLDFELRSLSDIKELVELRKENAELKKQVEFEMGEKAKARKQRNTLAKSLPIRDLEQQAKGLEDYAKEQESGLNAVWMLAKSTRLREQANKLKGQE